MKEFLVVGNLKVFKAQEQCLPKTLRNKTKIFYHNTEILNNKNLILRYKSQRVFIVYENLCRERSFDVVNRDHRSTRQLDFAFNIFALWIIV